MTLEMPDFIGFAMRMFLRGSNPSLPTNKGLQETADPFVFLEKPVFTGLTQIYQLNRQIIKTLYKPVYKPN